MDPIEVPFEFGGHLMPGFWRYILPKDIRNFKLPRERQSTCNSCPKVCYEDWNKDYRCCTYHPEVPNFLIGLGLRNPTAKKAIEDIKPKGFLVPEGFISTPQQYVDYLADTSEDYFGRANRVVCPLLDTQTGHCNIYAFRNSVCSTFFCENDHGERGENFWESLEEVVSQIETALMQWSLKAAGYDLLGYMERVESLASDLEAVYDPKTRGWNTKTLEFLWGADYGKEFELFHKCAEQVSENRDRLWDIANEWDILDNEKYEKALFASVPEKYEDEIDPSDLEEGETYTPEELARTLRRKYKQLEKIPTKARLSPRVRIRPNPMDDKRSKDNEDKPFVLEFLKKRGGKRYDWRDFITEAESKAFQKFNEPQSTEALAEDPELQSLSLPPGQFLSEWVGRRVLERA